MRKSEWAFLVTAGLAFTGCSADTEPESPGSCSLNCSQKRAPAGEYLVAPYFSDPAGDEVTDAELEYTCPSPPQGQFAADLPAPFRVLYRVYEKIAGFGGKPKGENDTSVNLADFVPRGGIGFEPFIIGGVSTPKTNEEHRNADGTVTPAKFTGIVTPRSEWCSDSCGVMTYELWGVCVAGKENPITASVISGAARVKGFYKILVKNEED